MKLIYLANIRLPTEKAHGYQIVQTCAEIAAQGVAVELVVPNRRNLTLGGKDPFEYYGIKLRFPIRRLPCLDTVSGVWGRLTSPLGFWVQTLTFSWFARRYVRKTACDWVYSRDELLVSLLGKIPHRTALELHALPKPKYRLILDRAERIVVITAAIRDGLVGQGISRDKIVVAPDAVMFDQFSRLPSAAECRRRVGLPAEKKIALYSGHLFDWKGIYVLAEAARLLPPPWQVVFVGGVPEHVERFRQYADARRLSNVTVIPHQQHEQVPYYLGAADVVVLPNSARLDRSRLYTSPLKLFEYLACGRPVVASCLPSIREVVSEREVVFVKPDDAADLARGIRQAGEHDQSARTQAAQTIAQRHSWTNRARVIAQALATLPKS